MNFAEQEQHRPRDDSSPDGRRLSQLALSRIDFSWQQGHRASCPISEGDLGQAFPIPFSEAGVEEGA